MKNSLVRYNTSVPSLNRDEFLTPFSSLFETFFNDNFPELHSNFGVDFFGKGSYPKVDIRDELDKVVIEAEVPGLKKEQVLVEVEDNVLRIKGEKQSIETKEHKYIHKELKRSSFCRSFSLGENVDKNNVSAKFENGILEITLNKVKPTPKTDTVKQIEVR